MSKRLYIGNLPFAATEETLEKVFGAVGQVESVKVIRDRDSGRSKGFAFVEMSTDEEAAKAISELSGKDCDGRPMTVSEARPIQPREDGGRRSGGGFRDETSSRRW